MSRSGWTARSRSSPAPASGIGLATARRFAAEGAKVVCADVDGGAGAAGGRRGRRPVRRRSTSPTRSRCRRCSSSAVDDLRRRAHRLQQRRHLAARRRLDPRHRARGVGPGAAGQPDLGLPVLQVRHRAHAAGGGGSIINTASFVAVLGLGDVADLLHRQQGRRAGDEPRARRAVRPRGHPGQRAVPGPDQHPAAAGAVRQGPRAGGAADGAHPDGPLRRGRRDRRARWPSWPATTRRSSPPRPSWSTAASAAPTSPRSTRPRARYFQVAPTSRRTASA